MLNVKNCINKSSKDEAQCFIYTPELKSVMDEFLKLIKVSNVITTAPENSIIVVERHGIFIRSEAAFLEQYEYADKTSLDKHTK